MRQWMGYMIFKDKEDFLNHVQHDSNRYHINGGIIEIAEQYPACFHYSEGWEPGWMGSWDPCSPDVMFNAWEQQIKSDIDFLKSTKEIWQRA